MSKTSLSFAHIFPLKYVTHAILCYVTMPTNTNSYAMVEILSCLDKSLPTISWGYTLLVGVS